MSKEALSPEERRLRDYNDTPINRQEKLDFLHAEQGLSDEEYESATAANNNRCTRCNKPMAPGGKLEMCAECFEWDLGDDGVAADLINADAAGIPGPEGILPVQEVLVLGTEGLFPRRLAPGARVPFQQSDASVETLYLDDNEGCITVELLTDDKKMWAYRLPLSVCIVGISLGEARPIAFTPTIGPDSIDPDDRHTPVEETIANEEAPEA